VSLRKLTTIDYFIKNYQLDKVIGEILFEKKAKLNQLTIKQYLEAKSLDLNHNFKRFKALLIQSIVYYHIAFF